MINVITKNKNVLVGRPLMRSTVTDFIGGINKKNDIRFLCSSNVQLTNKTFEVRAAENKMYTPTSNYRKNDSDTNNDAGSNRTSYSNKVTNIYLLYLTLAFTVPFMLSYHESFINNDHNLPLKRKAKLNPRTVFAKFI
ncbi:uncharacterized protein SCDLUD_001997 [Saccharomycodes ludwigii]|uniref:uncharacterized protein n=1 Tax=Saccharomycodes ludwigii TaxID=36035 RepID=UPI001E8705D3|nr:hypothetical protein SCDLUD_001997 [Saccharomycodes ludwigii]KAH3902182.1 hypothetical protein SCDLUD_001997 [Saccharomycodes ludwigii]